MKTIYIIIIGLLLHIKAYSQNTIIQTDSTVKNLKDYLGKSVKFPSIAIKDYTQGTMIVCFKINKGGKINDIHFARHLTGECDSVVVKTLNNYSRTILLPPNEYTVGLRFLILDDGKPDSQIVPIDKSRYKNFLFELNVEGELIRRKTSILN